jgi:hypothetical protein
LKSHFERKIYDFSFEAWVGAFRASVYEEIPFYLLLTAGGFQRVYPAELKKLKDHKLLAEIS